LEQGAALRYLQDVQDFQFF